LRLQRCSVVRLCLDLRFVLRQLLQEELLPQGLPARSVLPQEALLQVELLDWLCLGLRSFVRLQRCSELWLQRRCWLRLRCWCSGFGRPGRWWC
jgi:hypothetical protein